MIWGLLSCGRGAGGVAEGGMPLWRWAFGLGLRRLASCVRASGLFWGDFLGVDLAFKGEDLGVDVPLRWGGGGGLRTRR